MTEKSKAEAYVRNKFPELRELSFGCQVYSKTFGYKRTVFKLEEKTVKYCEDGEYDMLHYFTAGYIEIIGHPIQPHHWLNCLVEVTKNGNWMLNYRNEIVDMTNFGNKHFKNKYLIIGTKRFYKEFNSIVGVNE